jgi:hypothetical protein
MTDPVKDLVAYLSGEPGAAGDRCRRALADPASDLSHFLTAARERTRSAVAEPAFRGLGLSPAACLPADAETPAIEPEHMYDRRWLPWLFASLAILVAALMAWAPWRAAAGPRDDDQPQAPGPVAARPAIGDVRLDQPGQFPRGEARIGSVEIPATGKPDPVGSEKAAVPAKPSGLPVPPPVPDQVPTGPAPPIGVPTKVPDPVPAQPPTPGPPGDNRAVIEALAKRLKAAEDRARDLERDNDALKQQNANLQAQVNKLILDVARAAQAHTDCLTRAAAQQKAIDVLQARIDTLKPLEAEALRLRARVKELEAALKAPPIDPAKPKPGPGLLEPKKKP